MPGLARQLDPPERPVEPPPPVIETAAAGPPHRAVERAPEDLRRLLRSREVTRFSLADDGLLA